MTALPVRASAASPDAHSGPVWDLYDAAQRRRMLLALFLVSTSSYADRNLISVVLEPIKAEYAISDIGLGVLTGAAFAVFHTAVGIPLASLADRGDRRTIVVASLGVWSVMTALCGWAGSFLQLAAARLGVGAGEAGITPAAQSLVADYFPPEQRARALGIFMMSSVAGAVVGLVAGGFLATWYGWRAAFWVCGGLGLPLGFVAYRLLREPRTDPRVTTRHLAPESIHYAWRKLAGDAPFRYLLLAIVVLFVVNQGALSFTVSLIVRLHGLTLSEAGLYVAVVFAASAVIGNGLGGYWGDRLGRRDPRALFWLASGSVVLATPCLVLGFEARSLTGMLTGLFFGLMCMCIMTPPLFAALHAICADSRRAMAVAVVYVWGNVIGVGGGPVVTGWLSDAFALSYGTNDGLRHAMAAMAMLLPVSGVMMLLAAGRYGRRREQR